VGIYLGTLPVGDRLVELARVAADLTPGERAADVRVARMHARVWGKLLAGDPGRWPPRLWPGVGAYGSPRPAVGRSWFRVGATVAGRAQVYVFDDIGEYGVSGADFAARLAAITAPAIDLYVDSNGGLCLDTFAVWQAIRAHPARTTAHVAGLAASAASLVARACDEVAVGAAGRMMIHDAQGFVICGDPGHVRNLAELLDELSGLCAGLYAAGAGGTAAGWRARMTAGHGEGTWYSAREAVAAGLADRIEHDRPDPGRWTVARPRALAGAGVRHAVTFRR
jgi:ATP-dependent protease ClpP protease subunit